MKNPRVSLEQWLTFKTVVDSGSYAMAAEALNKSQSSISYAIARLNEQLPQPVLVLEGRKAVVTDAGQVLYRHAEQLLNQASQTESVASSLALGFESEVAIAVDVLVEIGSLVCAFEEFSQEFPHTRIRVLETSLSGTTEALIEKTADLVVGSKIPSGFRGTPLLQVKMIPVAAAYHPLVKNRKSVSEVELRNMRQVVLRDTGTHREQDAGWLQAEQRWTVSHFSTSIKLLRSGLVFAFIPQNWIEDELAQGSLQRIPVEPSMDRIVQMNLMLSNHQASGPATKALYDTIIDKLSRPSL
ncbi:MAG: transcriptional regulator [SAR86 cluster bacterium]|uniref:Transcriptional regulator n=1 Tax=SAR86 cluster bacterium TaxID=2030880 RepID=A0A2A4WVM3_9GAMM|nr:MAG: transcriptional regulator [SAR86 cluster bacterium]